MGNDRSISSRTTERAIERAVLGVLAAGVEVGRVIVHSGGKVEIIAASCDVRVGSTQNEVELCDALFTKKSPTTVTLKGIKRVKAPGGQMYLYVRRSDGPDVRLPDLPTSDPEFLKAYTAAREAPKRVQGRHKAGSIGAVFTACLASEDIHTVSPAYRAMIRRHADDIWESYGPAPIRGLERRHIQKDVDNANASGHRRKTWRWVVKWAILNGFLDSDPTERVALPRTAPTDGHPAWTADDVQAFRNHWPLETRQRLAMELLQWSGARISDAVILGPQHVGKDGVIAYTQKKTGSMAYCPWRCVLPSYAVALSTDRETMHAAIDAREEHHLTFLATIHGKSRSANSIGGVISSAARAVGIEKSAHGLRKYRATQLAHAGATPHQIGAWTGHESLREIEHYTKSVNRHAAVPGTPTEQESGKTLGPLPKQHHK
jgi:integrase/recombinase XerD